MEMKERDPWVLRETKSRDPLRELKEKIEIEVSEDREQGEAEAAIISGKISLTPTKNINNSIVQVK